MKRTTHSCASLRRSRTIRSSLGIQAFSRGPEYGIGVSSPLTRTGAASSDPQACPTTWATIVAPQLPAGGHSWTQARRPVFATLAAIVARSRGASVLGSISSTSMPSLASDLCGLQRPMTHQLRRDHGHIRARANHLRATQIDETVAVRRPLLAPRRGACARRRERGCRRGSRRSAGRRRPRELPERRS